LNSCCSKLQKMRACQAFALGLLLPGACTDTSLPGVAGAGVCQSIITPITAIQGDGYHSPLVDSLQTVRGTVTYVDADAGFYLEDMESSPDPASSRALFISDIDLARSVQPGQQLELSGRVSELGKHLDKLTALVEVSGHEICAGETVLPLTRAQLPINSAAREALEGMRVSFEQMLTLTDVYNFARGELTLSSNGVLRVPTEVVMPGSEARELEKQNRNHSLVAVLPVPGAALAVGATTQIAAGLMGNNGRAQQLYLAAPLEMEFAPPSLPPAARENTIRVVNSNLLNFFNGDGKGEGFPTERGAATMDEFLAQSARTRAAMEQMQPDLLAVQELENDGFGLVSAAQSLLNLLQDTGHDDWAFIAPGTGGIGGDVITVGLFYRQQVLQAIGPPRVLDSPEFRRLSRQPMAQLFRDVRTGQIFLVAVNHLKSKGSCPDGGENSDQEDGQGCWNKARVAAVEAQIPWLEGLAEDTGTKNILILGDMNAWRNEDPIRQFTDSGLIDLVAHRSGLPQHSFLYWGQTGTLDYAFASPALLNHVQTAAIWNSNADWPAGMGQPSPWLRASDHDPVIVDLDFNHSATSD
jgi:predicted extracellular nuclease